MFSANQVERTTVRAPEEEVDYTFLDKHTPVGLFAISCGCRLYLVVQHEDRKRAISLTAWDDPAFSVTELTKERLEFGRWWGAPRLRLTTIMRGFIPPLATGIILTDGDELMLSCVMPGGTREWLPIGVVDVPDDYDVQYFCGWQLDDPGSPYPYFERNRQLEHTAAAYIPANRRKCMTRIETKFLAPID